MGSFQCFGYMVFDKIHIFKYEKKNSKIIKMFDMYVIVMVTGPGGGQGSTLNAPIMPACAPNT